MPQKRRGRAADSPAAPTFTTTDIHHSADSSDHNERTDEFKLDRLLGGPAADIWAKLFNGEFKLAVPCSRCGRWLTSGASKRHRMGAKCRAKSTAAAVA